MSQNLPEPSARLTNAEFAHKIGVSERTVRAKRKAGMSDEQIALEAQTKSWKHDPHRRVRERAASEDFALTSVPAPRLISEPSAETAAPGSDRTELQTVTLERERTKLESEKIELGRKRGELINRKSAEIEFTTLLTELRDQMLAIPDRLAPRLAMVDDARQVRRELMDVIVQVLSVVANDAGERAA